MYYTIYRPEAFFSKKASKYLGRAEEIYILT
jgi:hypothetical protein